MNGSRSVIQLVNDFGECRPHLLKRRPHHPASDEQIQQQHRRLADAVSSVALSFHEKSTRDKGRPQDELCDQVEIRRERGTCPEKILGLERKTTQRLVSSIQHMILQPLRTPRSGYRLQLTVLGDSS
jgi:hypothetical protein